MECVAWFTHKYLMHGVLWVLHRDHHNKERDGFFERNDAFFLIFAVPGILLIYFGTMNGAMDPRLWIGAGITLYGAAYVFVHDIFIHQRVRFLTRTNNVYFAALRKAHKVHHKHLSKEDGECFGMLWPPRKYLIEARQKQEKYQA
jgi:beta-carotene 3-hydroxylase